MSGLNPLIRRALPLVLISQACNGCYSRGAQAPIVKQPTHTHKWTGAGHGLRNWGRNEVYLYATTIEPEALEVWKWANRNLRMQQCIPAEGMDVVTVGPNDELLYTRPSSEKEDAVFLRRGLNGVDEVRHPLPPGWWCDQIHSSQSGGYIAVGLKENGADPPPGYRGFQHPREMIGLVAPKATEINWIGTLGGKESAANNIRRLIPSNDGRFVAAAGWDNGLAMLDCSTGEQLWWTRPPNEVSCYYAAFAPDNKVIYTGGGEGCVYGLNVQSGKVVSQWYASKSGKSEYGHRISDIAVSPDGKWVAAGTGPEGLVWIFDTAQGKAACVLEHGYSTVALVAFSPDSKAVATFVPGTLKVWDVTLWSKPVQP